MVPFLLGVQVTRYPRNYRLNLFENYPTIVIVDHGQWDGPGLSLLENLWETVGGDWQLCQMGYAVAVGWQYLPALFTRVPEWFPGEIRTLKGLHQAMVWWFSAWSTAYEVPRGGLIPSVSGLLIIVDGVRFCVCKSLFLILINCGRSDNKTTNKQKRSTLLAGLATWMGSVLVLIKKSYSK